MQFIASFLIDLLPKLFPRIRRINSCFRLVSRSQIFPRLETGRFRRALPLRDKKEEEENAGLISSAITKVKKRRKGGKKENRVIIRSMRKEYPLSNCRIPSPHSPPLHIRSMRIRLRDFEIFEMFPSFLPSFVYFDDDDVFLRCRYPRTKVFKCFGTVEWSGSVVGVFSAGNES